MTAATGTMMTTQMSRSPVTAGWALGNAAQDRGAHMTIPPFSEAGAIVLDRIPGAALHGL
jgi:hypothetical protein